MKVGHIGASMRRGNATNFYIRCDDDLDDQDTNAVRGPLEYPHIHVVTTGSHAHDDILYIGITFGGNGGNIDIYRNNAHLIPIATTIAHIQGYLPRISAGRVHPLAQYLHGYRVQVAHQ